MSQNNNRPQSQQSIIPSAEKLKEEALELPLLRCHLSAPYGRQL